MKFNNKMLRNIFLGMALFTAAAALHSCGLGNNNADDKQKNTGTVADTTVEPLPITFVDSATGRARNNYYQKNKAAIVNSGGFYFSSVEGLKNQLQTFIKGKTGLRIYMAQTNTKKDSNNMALIFAPTVAGAKSNFTDAGDYTIVLPGAGSFTPIPKKADAEQYVKNYITDKKTSLDKTLTTADRSEGDTKSVLFSSDQINAICREMEYQKKTTPDSIKGMWIALTAHTDSDTAAPQRLNVIFPFSFVKIARVYFFYGNGFVVFPCKGKNNIQPLRRGGIAVRMSG
jgi:hypothetical protein